MLPPVNRPVRKVLLGLLFVIAVVAAALFLKPVRLSLVNALLPNAPDWPAPQRQLAAGDEGVIYYASRSPYDLEVIFDDISEAPATTGKGYLSYPASASVSNRVPAMVIVPGSGGIAPGREHEYAKWFNARGVAAFVVEYYEPRGFGKDDNYLLRTASVTEFDLIADAYAALVLLDTSPLIDGERVGIIGFSYGGMAARLSMDARIHAALAPQAPPFSLHVDVYGPCFQNLQSTDVGQAPLLTLRGTKDASNDLDACKVREDELRALGTDVTAHVYEGAGHAWEVDRERFLSEDSPYIAGCELQYDDNGRAMLGGEPLNEYSADAPHAAKMLARFTSASKLESCVGWGYLVGRDTETRDRAYADLEVFLQAQWKLAAGL